MADISSGDRFTLTPPPPPSSPDIEPCLPPPSPAPLLPRLLLGSEELLVLNRFLQSSLSFSRPFSLTLSEDEGTEEVGWESLEVSSWSPSAPVVVIDDDEG